CWGAGKNFHSFTASWHDCTSSGCPPMTRELRTWPSGVMITSILTLPETFIRRASSGYVGEVFVITFRLPSSVFDCCADAPDTNRATAANDIASRVQRDFIANSSSCSETTPL